MCDSESESVCCLQEAEKILERIDQLHLEFAKRAAVCDVSSPLWVLSQLSSFVLSSP